MFLQIPLIRPGPKEPIAHQAYISQSTDPLFNLSLEDFLFRSRPAHVPVCLVYRNAPCVVIGRNQNPWRELDVRQMNLVDLPLVRRRSGGGAVYHVCPGLFIYSALLD